jgi:acyl dehydratase
MLILPLVLKWASKAPRSPFARSDELGAILHGLCTYNIAAVQVLRAFGNSDPSNFKSFEARFSSPVMPGGTAEFGGY